MAYTMITASNPEDLVTQMNTFEQSFAQAGEVVDYQIPVLNSAGEIDDSDGPDCGATGNVEDSRRALVSYFGAWSFVPQPVQTRVMRLPDNQMSDWLSFDEASAFTASA